IAPDRDSAVAPRVLIKRMGAVASAICGPLGTSGHFDFVNITGCRTCQLATVAAPRRSGFGPSRAERIQRPIGITLSRRRGQTGQCREVALERESAVAAGVRSQRGSRAA